MKQLNDRLMLNKYCEFTHVHMGVYDCLVRVQQYRHLAGEAMTQMYVPKAVIEVHKQLMSRKSLWTMPVGNLELIAFLGKQKNEQKQLESPLVFVSIDNDTYKKDRAIFYGDSGLAEANHYLNNLPKDKLALAIWEQLFKQNIYDDE